MLQRFSTSPFSVLSGLSGLDGLDGTLRDLFALDPFAAQRRVANARPGSRGFAPAVDLAETRDAVVLRVDLPGVNPTDLDLKVEDGVLTIRGHRQASAAPAPDSTANTTTATTPEVQHLTERAHGSFARSFKLPTTVDPDKMGAAYQQGVLTITMPKRSEAKPRSITVQVG
jgi:HSP20 family protein